MDIHVNRSARVAETPLTPQPPALVLFGRGAAGKPCAAWFEAAEAEAATAAATTMRLRTLPVETDEQRRLASQLARGRVTPGGRARVTLAKHDLYARLVALAGEEAGLRLMEGEPRVATASATTATAAGPDAGTAKTTNTAAERAADPSAGAGTRTLAAGTRDGDGAAKPGPTGAAAEAPAKPRPGDRSFVGQPRPGDRDEIGLGSLVLAHEGPDDGWWEAEVIGVNGRVLSLRWRDYPTQPTILRKAGELALLPPGEA